MKFKPEIFVQCFLFGIIQGIGVLVILCLAKYIFGNWQTGFNLMGSVFITSIILACTFKDKSPKDYKH